MSQSDVLSFAVLMVVTLYFASLFDGVGERTAIGRGISWAVAVVVVGVIVCILMGLIVVTILWLDSVL